MACSRWRDSGDDAAGGAEALVMLQDDTPELQGMLQGDARDVVGPVVRVPIPPR